jgi:hypothetical protein
MTLARPSSFPFLPLGGPPLACTGGSFFSPALLCALRSSANLCDNLFLSEALAR